MRYAFQSTLPAGGATKFMRRALPWTMISIHAPRRGSDGWTHWVIQKIVNFNPRSPQGERRGAPFRLPAEGEISIHAPRRGSDSKLVLSRFSQIIFQSTLPAGGATQFLDDNRIYTIISIHAPRRGSDLSNARH